VKSNTVEFLDFVPDDDLVQYAHLILKQIQSASVQELKITTELTQNPAGQYFCRCQVSLDEPVVIKTTASNPRQALDLLDLELRKELGDMFQYSHFDPTSW
jgi:hypothetical protein